MDKENQRIVKKIKEKYKNENVEDRTSRWVLGTIKYQYDFGYIIGSGALNEERAYKEKFKELNSDEQKYLIETCSNAYKPFKKYLLVYVCYLFGAFYENCKRNNLEFSFSGIFLKKQLKNLFKMIERFYKKPDKEANIWMPMFDGLFDKKDLDLNKNFFLAHFPPLENKHLESIVNWFLDNRKTNQSIKNVFDTARNYFHLEVDKNSPFKKITSENDWEGTMRFSIDGDTNKYENTTLNSNLPLRFTYYMLASQNLHSLNESYINSKPKARIWQVEKLITNIIQNGPDLKMQENQYNEI